MAAPALKPCPVCMGTGGFLGRGFAACVCGMVVRRHTRAKAAADWNRLSDLAAARTRAAVREALEETGRSEQRLRDLLHVLRMFADDLERHLPAPSDRLPSSTPPQAQRAAHGGTDERKAEAADLPRVQRAGQAIRGDENDG